MSAEADGCPAREQGEDESSLLDYMKSRDFVQQAICLWQCVQLPDSWVPG